jgi:hypothetical protein
MIRIKVAKYFNNIDSGFMKAEESQVTRRKMVLWLGVLSLFSMVGAAFRPSNRRKVRTVKMLTQDGKLVEIDASILASGNKKISDKELQNWVKK